MLKNKKYLVTGIAIVLLLSVIAFLYVNFGQRIYSSSFTLKISGDYTSSGASRNYDASIVYKDGVAVSGTQTYFVGEGGGCQTNCNRTTTCNIVNQKWIDSISLEECSLGHNEYLSKAGVDAAIKEQKLKPISNCGHLDTCYELK